MNPDPVRRQELKDAGHAVAMALLVHVLVIGLLLLGTLNWQPFQPPQPQPAFTLVDAGPILEERRQEAEQERRQEQEAERERELEEQRREQELERQREAERQAERDRQQEVERQRQEAERQRQQEAERQAERDRQQEAERQRQQEQERERLQELERQRREAEEARQRELEDLRRQREEARLRREEEERQLAEIAERRAREEADRRAREEADRLRLAQEQAEAQARQATLQEEYMSTIAELVRRNWIRPPTTNPGVRCTVRVIQIPGGEIIDAAIASPCNADDATRRSILSAVNRTRELPYRGYESVFSREIEFIFRYEG